MTPRHCGVAFLHRYVASSSRTLELSLHLSCCSSLHLELCNLETILTHSSYPTPMATKRRTNVSTPAQREQDNIHNGNVLPNKVVFEPIQDNALCPIQLETTSEQRLPLHCIKSTLLDFVHAPELYKQQQATEHKQQQTSRLRNNQ